MKRIIALLIILVLSTASAECALIVEGVEVSDGEARTFMMTALENYRDAADYYAQCLGIDFWSLTYASGVTVEESIQADVFKQIVMMNLFYARALEEGYTLSEADEASCQESATEMLELINREDCAYDDALTLTRKELLANRMYGALLSETEIDAQSVYAEGSFSVELEYLYTAELKANLQALIPESGDLQEAAQASSDLSYGTVTVTLGTDEPLAQAAETLLPGCLSDVITTDYGLFVVRLLESDAEAVAAAALAEALYNARVEAFSTEYERLYENADYTIYQSFRDALSLSGLK